jgi:hypothetical protein
MDFGTGDGSKSKAWRDIWGSGQGIGAVTEVQPAGSYVAKLRAEYEAAKAELIARLELLELAFAAAQKERSSRLSRLRAGLACGSGMALPSSSLRTRA